MKFGNRELRVAVIVATGFIGCADGSDSGSGEQLGELSQGWSVASCDTPAADVTFEHSIAGHETPQSYNKCTKSYIIEVSDMGGAGGAGGTGASPGSGGGPITPQSAIVHWVGPFPATQAECEASFVGGILYGTGGGNGWQPYSGQVRGDGEWNGYVCLNLKATLWPLWEGQDYRFAVTGRNSANETQKLLVKTSNGGP